MEGSSHCHIEVLMCMGGETEGNHAEVRIGVLIMEQGI